MNVDALRAVTVASAARRGGICGDWRCMEEILRGDVIAIYPDAPEKPQHVRHYLDDVLGKLTIADRKADRRAAQVDEVLAFCAGLSAVSADWIGQQYQRRRNDAVY